MDTIYEAEILASEQQLLEAMKTSNVELLDQLLHDRLLFNGPDGQTATKALDLQNYRSGNVHLQSLEPSDRILSLIGNTAVVAVTVKIKGSYLGQEIDGKFRYLRVWQQSEPGWQVIAGSVIPLHS